MTDDQHRIGKLTGPRLLIADALERHAADPRDPHAVADWLLERLQTEHGWRPPLDLTETPALRPTHVADEDSPGRRQFREALAALPPRRKDHQ